MGDYFIIPPPNQARFHRDAAARVALVSVTSTLPLHVFLALALHLILTLTS